MVENVRNILVSSSIQMYLQVEINKEEYEMKAHFTEILFHMELQLLSVMDFCGIV